MDGVILSANNNFLETLGYELEEIVGQHHRMFCEPEYAKSADYKKFWSDLGAGEFNTGEFKRIAKDGSDVWISATYNPVLDASGQPYKVVKVATDITEQKTKKRRL